MRFSLRAYESTYFAWKFALHSTYIGRAQAVGGPIPLKFQCFVENRKWINLNGEQKTSASFLFLWRQRTRAMRERLSTLTALEKFNFVRIIGDYSYIFCSIGVRVIVAHHPADRFPFRVSLILGEERPCPFSHRSLKISRTKTCIAVCRAGKSILSFGSLSELSTTWLCTIHRHFYRCLFGNDLNEATRSREENGMRKSDKQVIIIKSFAPLLPINMALPIY